MWLSDRNIPYRALRPTRRAVVFGLTGISLVGCGFEPALGTNGTLGAFQSRIRFDDPVDRNGFTLKTALEDRIGQGKDFGLSYQIETNVLDIGITPDRVITGQQIEGTVSFELVNIATGRVILSDKVEGFTSFGTTGTTASTAFANEAALDRLMIILSEKIIRRLSILPRVPV